MSRNESIGNNNVASTTQASTKLCHIVKRPNFEGYGFNLHSEKAKPGQYIGKVDANSPAEAAGLKEGDRIIEVNGVNISQESHKQVVQRIKSISNEVCLLIEEVLGAPDASRANNGSKDIKELPMKNIQHSTNEENSNIIEQHYGKDNTDYQSGATSIVTNEILQRPQNENSFATSSSKITSIGMPILKPTDSRQASSRGLELPLTAAEMREKLLSKKKYDPKNEVVDLKKKFEIIQKL